MVYGIYYTHTLQKAQILHKNKQEKLNKWTFILRLNIVLKIINALLTFSPEPVIVSWEIAYIFDCISNSLPLSVINKTLKLVPPKSRAKNLPFSGKKEKN